MDRRNLKKLPVTRPSVSFNRKPPICGIFYNKNKELRLFDQSPASSRPRNIQENDKRQVKINLLWLRVQNCEDLQEDIRKGVSTKLKCNNACNEPMTSEAEQLGFMSDDHGGIGSSRPRNIQETDKRQVSINLAQLRVQNFEDILEEFCKGVSTELKLGNYAPNKRKKPMTSGAKQLGFVGNDHGFEEKMTRLTLFDESGMENCSFVNNATRRNNDQEIRNNCLLLMQEKWKRDEVVAKIKKMRIQTTEEKLEEFRKGVSTELSLSLTPMESISTDLRLFL